MVYGFVDKYERTVDQVQEGTTKTIRIWIHLSINIFGASTLDVTICRGTMTTSTRTKGEVVDKFDGMTKGRTPSQHIWTRFHHMAG